MAVGIKVTGVDDTLARNIVLNLGQPANDSPRALKKFIDEIPKNADKAMQAIGYYNAAYDIQKAGSKTGASLSIGVIPGQAVQISKLDLRIQNEAQLDAGYMPVIGRIPVRGNGIFTHAEYEGTKSVLIDAALDRGYFDFQFTTSDVRISKKDSTAEITLIADSGVRYKFGHVDFKSDYFSDEFLLKYLPFQAGDFYESRKLASLTQQMQNTGFFNNVKVLPLRGIAYGKEVPLEIQVERKDKNYIGLGIGYETDTEWRTKLTWSKPLVNKAGHSFDSELGLSQTDQRLSFQYRIPRTRRPLHNYWSLEYGLQNVIDDELRSFLSTLNLQRIKRTKRGWRESLFVRWERETYEISGVRDRSDLVLPGVSYSKSKSVGSPFPKRGYNTSLQFLYGSRELLSDIDFYKSVINYKWLGSFLDLNTLILSLQYGAISTNDFSRVPVSQRFFAGGDRSVRGFDFRGISPVDEEGDPVGGRYLEVFSAEYNFQFRPRWAAALFVDTGRAFDDFKAPHKVGAGFGLRWFSPVGPFRMDFAYDVSEDDPGLTFHLSLGPDL